MSDQINKKISRPSPFLLRMRRGKGRLGLGGGALEVNPSDLRIDLVRFVGARGGLGGGCGALEVAHRALQKKTALVATNAVADA